MNRRGRLGNTAALAVLGVLTLTVPAFALMATGSAEAAPMAASSQQLWAYGAYRAVNVTGTGHDANGSYGYTLRAYYGWEVILTQTNVSSTMSTLEINRTMAAFLDATLCRPTCVASLSTANLTARAVEVSVGFANYTTAGSVYEAGQPVPAIALLNTSTQLRANFTEFGSVVLASLLGQKQAVGYLSISANAAVHVGFTPALGLFPFNATAGNSWNSSAAFLASGTWALRWVYNATGLTGLTVSGGSSAGGNVSEYGNLTLAGQDSGPITLADGSVANALSLTVGGPFAVREGILFVPEESDLFGTGNVSGDAGSHQHVVQSATTTFVDVKAVGLSHLGLLTSASTFNSGADAWSTATEATPVARPASLPATDSTGPVTVQAQPQTVTAAQQQSGCLLAGTCPIPPALVPSRLPFLLLAGAVLAALVASVVVVARRRSTPAPPHPNAHLYPPGTAERAGPPSGAVGSRAAPAADEPDPLGHLW